MESFSPSVTQPAANSATKAVDAPIAKSAVTRLTSAEKRACIRLATMEFPQFNATYIDRTVTLAPDTMQHGRIVRILWR